MHRRLLITALACLASSRAAAQEPPPPARPRHKVSAARLHEALSARFPLRSRLGGGLLRLEVSAPGLLLLPARNKLGASLVLQAGGPALQRVEQGELDLVFGLRYEPADRTLRAVEPEILDLRLPGARPELLQLVQQWLPRLSREIGGELVLHTFDAKDLALPDAMGVQPGTLTVVEDGVVVEFVGK